MTRPLRLKPRSGRDPEKAGEQADAHGEAGPVRGGATPIRVSRSLTDTDLLAGIRAGRADALEALLERYWAPLVGYVARRSGSSDFAADVVQDVFCRIWERRTEWRSHGSVAGLLYRLARNTAVSQQRRGRARERAAGTYRRLMLNRTPPPLPAERVELRDALEAAIARLSPRRREVFELRMLDGLSYQEIAHAMGTSKQTVANQFSRALTLLRESLAHLLS
ncbi:MAG: RNA polymerase sigma factor [Longimicrobiales bacterium]